LVSRVRQAFQVELPLRSVFESPTIADLALHIETAFRAGEVTHAPPIVAIEREGELPLSFAQQRLWFLDQLEPGSPLYNISAAVKLLGNLNIRALEETLSEIVRRHEVLRTSFSVVDGEPVQVIAPTSPFAVEVTDLSEWDDAAREAEAQRIVREEALQSFDLAQGPLLRVRLVRLSAVEHLSLFTMHHIISDGWSMGVLIREVAILYAAFSKGEASPLPELAIQYADFAVWQKSWLQGEVLDEQIEYWKRQLAGAPSLLPLPTDHPRSIVQTHRGAKHSFVFAGEVASRLSDMTRFNGETLFMILLAAFKVLLYHYSKQSDLVVGAGIANRNRSEMEGLIGFFVNMLAMRTDLSGDPTFRELLQRVQEVTLDAYAHQDLPFEKLVEELRPERDLSYHPVFQVAIVLQNAPMPTLTLPGLTIDPVEKDKDVARFDLLLDIRETPEGLGGSFTYNVDLWERETISRMVEHLQAVLREVVANPDLTLSALENKLAEIDRQRQAARQREFKEVRRQKLQQTKLRAVETNLAQESQHENNQSVLTPQN
jgi:hypothetical protein